MGYGTHKKCLWIAHTGRFVLPQEAAEPPKTWQNGMYPHGLALHHPAAATLLSYVTKGCPVHTGNNWVLEHIEVAIAQGPHASALIPAAIEQMTLEVQDKVKKGQWLRGMT